VRRSLLALVTLASAFVALTAWALESGGVARIETRAADGSERITHVWYATPDGEVWLEAGTPENGWYLDVLAGSRVTLQADDREGCFGAEVVDTPETQTRVRRLLHEKYGWRDAWVGLFVDSGRSVAVRLVPADCA